MVSALSAPHFHSEEAAFAYVEARVWPKDPTCSHCGGVERISKMQGKSTRLGLYKCYQCRKPFTVRMGTIFEASHVALNIWLQAMYLIAGSKKGISSNQLHRTLGVTLKTAWFMSHRIREAMRGGLDLMGGEGLTVEADETYIGLKKGVAVPQGGFCHKHCVVSLVCRETGEARYMFTDNTTHEAVANIFRANVARESRLMTDDHIHYRKVGREFVSHGRIRHSIGEYDRGDVYTNTIEGFFRSSSAGCVACISSAARSICTAISRNSISARPTAPRSAETTRIAPTRYSVLLSESGSPTNNLLRGPNAEEGESRNTEGAERAVQKRRAKARGRWRTRPKKSV